MAAMNFIGSSSLASICTLALLSAGCGDDPDAESVDAGTGIADGSAGDATVPDPADAALPDAATPNTFATIQAYAVNSDAAALTLDELSDAGVVGAIIENLPLYKIAVAATDAIADLAQLQLIIDNVNGLAGAEAVEQGGSSNGIAIAANGTYWLSIDNGFANHQIRVTTVDNIDVSFDIFYPGYRGIESPNFSYNDQPQGASAVEIHNTGATEVLPDGIVYFRVTELSGNAGSFNFFDSD